jgi:methionyl-tRNA formyltransferase
VFEAVVFAYSEVGFRCLAALLDANVAVRLVVTHEDSPTERPWFASVARLARERGIEVSTADPRDEALIRRIEALAPHYILSFYYRSMLAQRVLAAARWGALNMHGSLLPKYRGRAPVNWAILNGERETGATLHYMVSRPDAGAIVGAERVPIGIDDTALTVSLAVAEAAQRLLTRTLPQLAAGPPAGRAMDLARGAYCRGRSPEDGRIDWAWPAARVHNLIRAVAPPFPGAFTDTHGGRLVFDGSRWLGEPARHAASGPCLYVEGGALKLDCCDGLRLAVPGVRLEGRALGVEAFERLQGAAPLRLSGGAAPRSLSTPQPLTGPSRE